MSFLERIVAGESRQGPLLQRLRESGKPVLIYGAGVYAYVLNRYLAGSGIQVAAVMVDVAYKSDPTFMGLEVVATEDTLDRIAEYEVVIGTANYPAAVEKLIGLGLRHPHVIDVPDFLNIPDGFMTIDFVMKNAEAFERAYQLFADDLSRETYVAAINTKINEDVTYLRPYVRPDHLYFTSTEFPLRDDEILLDVGGFTGDSIHEFHEITKGRYRGIISLEPFQESFARLRATVDSLGLSKVVPLKIGAWDEKAVLSFATRELRIDNRIAEDGLEHIEVDTIDAILDSVQSPATMIKLDINGAEHRALAGARETIRRHRPRIAVKMHVKEDFFRLPILLKEQAPDMKLYLRQRNFMSMMLVLYGLFEDGDDRKL
jgi:FkbM family methyltransferase